MGEQITAIAKVGDQIEVEGRPEVTPRGDRVFEISQITSGKETVRIFILGRSTAPKPSTTEPMSAEGRVTEYVTNPHGDVDGLILNDNTIVKFPPHQSDELQELVKVGDEVKVEGRRHETPHGEVHLHADVISARASRSIGKGQSTIASHPNTPPGAAVGRATNAEILNELREIRKLLSERR